MIPPRLSLLTAVRDGLPHLDEAITSIRAQTRRDWEWILVDDGSRDGSSSRLDDWARRDRRIRVLHRPGRGLVPSLNDGLAHCCAPIVARMDADDIALPERLAAQSAYLAEHPGIAAADTQVALFGGERNAGMRDYVTWVNDHPSAESITDDLFVESPLVHPAVCFRAAAVREIGGYRDGDFPEDYDLWLRLHARGHKLGKLDRTVLLLWRDGPQRLSRTDARYRRAAFRRLRQDHLAQLDGSRLRDQGLVLWGASRHARPWRCWLRQLGARPEFVVEMRPERIGGRILDAPVVGLEEVARRPWRSMLVTVSGRAAREAIRRQLDAWGLANGDAGRHVRYV
jgi:glycosyltransferase involved in cell wall biosynthesis